MALWRPMNFRCVEASGTSFGFGWPKWQALAQAIVAALEDYHKKVPDSPGLEQDRLRRAVDIRLPGPAFDAAATAMVEDGILRRGRGSSCLVTPSDCPCPMSDYGCGSSRSWNAHASSHRGYGTSPACSARARRRCGGCCGASPKWACSSKYRTTAFYPGPRCRTSAAARLLAERSQSGKITAAAFRDRIGIGRKLAIQILKFFDRTGTTIRAGDLRRLREDQPESVKGAGD